MIIRIHNILEALSAYNPGADLDIIRRAYVFAAKSHQGQLRRSGEAYLTHPLAVAGLLTEMRMDVPSLVAALLHDTVEDTVATLEEIERDFGSEVRDLVDGVTKLSKIKFSTNEEKQAENFRKMIMAMAKDIRVIMIKLADRLHNMRTLEHLAEDRRLAIAQETIDVYDLIAFRVMVDTLQQCYEALGVIHSVWRPVPGRFKDYIAMPKGNNYQSLHTTVIGPEGIRVEFQIRTRDMHNIAEHGIAAHWKYKEGRLIDDKDEIKFKWVRRLLEWQRELSDPTEFLDTVKLDLFADDVYVFTPHGDLKEFPRGSTPVDFAYAVHTDVGHSCVGAKVNGKIVPLRYHLRSGDSLEIVTQKQKRPNKDWLNFVVTSRAKAKIRQFLRSEEHGQSEAIGRELLEKAASRYGLSVNDLLKNPVIEKFARDASYDGAIALLPPIA